MNPVAFAIVVRPSEEFIMSIPFHKTRIAVLLSTLALCAPVLAADSPMQGAAMQHSSSATMAMRDMRVTELIGSDVRNAQGESLAEVKDLIIDVAKNKKQ